jgi:hypothetical protein
MAESREEAYVRAMFETRFSLAMRKLPEQCQPRQKTADFEMLHDGKRSGVLEVKLIERTMRTTENGWRDVTPHGVPSSVRYYERNDNAPSRVCALIHKAYQQLVAYAEPKVLVFVNDDHVVDVGDLTEAVTGGMLYETDGFAYINEITGTKAAYRRIAEEASKIDLYGWIDRHRVAPAPVFRIATSRGQQLAVQFFRAPADSTLPF